MSATWEDIFPFVLRIKGELIRRNVKHSNFYLTGPKDFWRIFSEYSRVPYYSQNDLDSKDKILGIPIIVTDDEDANPWFVYEGFRFPLPNPMESVKRGDL